MANDANTGSPDDPTSLSPTLRPVPRQILPPGLGRPSPYAGVSLEDYLRSLPRQAGPSASLQPSDAAQYWRDVAGLAGPETPGLDPGVWRGGPIRPQPIPGYDPATGRPVQIASLGNLPISGLGDGSLLSVTRATYRPNLNADPTGRNNPGNIKNPLGGFAAYQTPQAGVQAIRDNLLAYQDEHGLNTVAGIINRWSPPSENNTPRLIMAAAQRMGVDPNQPIDLHDPLTMEKMTNAIVLQEQGGAQTRLANLQGGQTTLTQPQPRGPDQWGRPDASWNIAGPPGTMPTQRDMPGIMGSLLQLWPIAAVAARVPLGLVLAGYNGMQKAQREGAILDYRFHQEQFEDAIKNHQALEQAEAQATGEAMAAYADNPDQMQRALMDIAGQYQDPMLMQLAQAQKFDAIRQLQERRDMLNQPAMKYGISREQRQAVADDVAARDQQYLATHPGEDQNSPGFRIQHAQNIGLATQEVTGKGKAAGAKPETRAQADEAAIEEETKAANEEWDKNNPNATAKERADAHLANRRAAEQQLPDKTGAARSDPYTGNWNFTNAETGQQETRFGTMTDDGLKVPGRKEPIRIDTSKPFQKVGTAGQAVPSTVTAPDTWPGAPNTPPPGVEPAVWSLALQWAASGKPPSGLARQTQMLARVEAALPIAQKILHINPTDEVRQQIKIAGELTANTAIARNFGSGQASTQMRSLNTVSDHLALIRQYAEALQNGDIPRANGIANRLAIETGHEEVTDFNSAKILVSDEIVRLLTNTGGTLTDRQDMQHTLDAANSPEQLTGWANTMQNFVRGRFNALQTQYVNVPGAGETEKTQRAQDFNQMLTPESQRIFEGSTAPIPGRARPPDATGPDGKPRWFKGGDRKDTGNWTSEPQQ